MKKKKLSNLRLNKVKIADLNTTQRISGGTGTGCDTLESRRICEGGDETNLECGGGGGGGTGVGCETVINCYPTQQCGPTQYNCGGTGTMTCTCDCP